MKYSDFIKSKWQHSQFNGFEPISIPDCLFEFQVPLVDWSIRKGRAALFEDCGLGKSIQTIVWADNVVRKTNKPVLLVTPLSVAAQFVREGDLFGYSLARSKKGENVDAPQIVVTNYEKLGYFSPSDFGGMACDESSILKNFDGQTRRLVTAFMRKIPYRLLASATPAPNDHMELGTSSEALGYMTRMNMLGMFFTNGGSSTQEWELKGHARKRFWEWMSSWARAIRKPSDLGFDDGGFKLPPLRHIHHTVPGKVVRGFFPEVASTLSHQRAEQKRTLRDRCELAASNRPLDRPAVFWCHLNDEGDMLTKLIPGAVQVKGSDSDDKKEESLLGFADGKIQYLVTKPKIASFGLNWQHCSDVFYFPSHSHEQFYQAIRRCWRFGQKRPVNCNLIYSESDVSVVTNMLRKEKLSIDMYDGIIRSMASNYSRKPEPFNTELELPSWL